MIGESLIIKKSIYSIGLRVHVNGTRGKSSIVKYIYAGLKAPHVKVMAKITGETPTLLLPDGSSETIKRRGSARVQEQFKIIHKAKRKKVDILILECMSIDPMFQKLESTFYKPNIYIISNIRDDHREKMGPTLDDQINSMCSAIPTNSKIIACESSYMNKIEATAKLHKSEFIKAVNLSDNERKLIPHSAHITNVEIALTVCLEANIPREKAFNAILKEIKTVESPVYTIPNTEHKQYFLNAFSVNDIQSVEDYLKHWITKLNVSNKIAIVLNTRADRPLRTDLFTDWINSNQENIDTVILTGDHKIRANRLLTKSTNNITIKQLKFNSQHNITDYIIEYASNTSLIVGLGNIGGQGFKIINEFSKIS